MITLKYLRDLYEQEKRSQKLQKIDDRFFEEVEEFFNVKKKLMEKSNLKAFQIAKEVENFRILLRMLFEKREQKIISLALRSLRSGIKIDLDVLLPVEQKFFSKLIELVKENEVNINKLIEGSDIFDTSSFSLNSTSLSHPSLKDEEEINNKNKDLTKPENEVIPDKKEDIYSSSYITLRVLEHIPSFLGENYEFYGPYEKGEKVILPKEIAEVLINLGKAKKYS